MPGKVGAAHQLAIRSREGSFLLPVYSYKLAVLSSEPGCKEVVIKHREIGGKCCFKRILVSSGLLSQDLLPLGRQCVTSGTRLCVLPVPNLGIAVLCLESTDACGTCGMQRAHCRSL